MLLEPDVTHQQGTASTPQPHRQTVSRRQENALPCSHRLPATAFCLPTWHQVPTVCSPSDPATAALASPHTLASAIDCKGEAGGQAEAARQHASRGMMRVMRVGRGTRKERGEAS